MQQYDVTGMSCAACSARVEKAVSKLDGVSSCSVSLLTNSMGVEGTASPDEIIKAVENAGYGASVKGKAAEKHSSDDGLKDTETPKILKRLIASLVFLCALMYFSMGHMFGLPQPPFFEHNHVAAVLTQLLLSAVVMVINQRFFISGFKAVIHRAPNMDTLVALGSGVSFAWSVYVLYLMTAAQASGDMQAASQLMHELYFESAAMILTLITVGKLLEAKSKGRTTDALKNLIKLTPKTAVAERNGAETEIPVEQVRTGDVFIVRAGGSIPVDGVVIEGGCAVDESALTGESVPVDKTVGDSVSAATISRSGYVKCRATRIGEDTTLSQIIKMVSDAAATKAPIAKIADRVSAVFVPAVIAVALVTAIVWFIIGQPADFALARAISVLVISCPCALGLATPVAIMVGSGVGARNGILFKTAVALEATGRLKNVVLDKTGTITNGEPVVTDIAANGSESELLEAAYALEAKSEHPLSRAVTSYAESNNISLSEISNYQTVAGNGLSATLGGEALYGGNAAFVSQFCVIPESIQSRAEAFANEGKTPLYFSKGNKLLGVIAVADTIKPDSAQAISQMRQMGLRVVMLTGDNEKTAAAIGAQAGVDEVIAGVLPDGKAAKVDELKRSGRTAMVGDGINDAPALTTADVGIAIGAGTDVAIDAADVVLVKSRLSDVAAAIRLGRATLRNIRENLFWAFIYNVIGIPIAAGAFYFALGWKLNPMFGAAAMSLSSFCVVTNALRLNFARIYPKKETAPAAPEAVVNTQTIKEKSTMTVTMDINGMMCAHCEARVKKTLEAIPQVESAEVSHTENRAVVTLKEEVPFSVLKEAVEAQDYEVADVRG